MQCWWLCEVFWDCFDEVWRGHQNGKGADNGEKRKRHQTEAIDDGSCKFPLAADGLRLVLVTKPLSDVHNFCQDAINLLLACVQPNRLPLFLWRAADSPSAAGHPWVAAGWAASTIDGVIAKIQVHVTVCGGVGRGWLTAHHPHLNAAGAGVMNRRVVVFVVGFPVLARLLHA